MIEKQFAYIKFSEEVLTKLEQYSQDSKDRNTYLTNFQNFKVEAKIIDDFFKRILLKNARDDLVKELLMQSKDKAKGFEKLVADLQRLDHANHIYLLVGGESKEALDENKSRGDCTVKCFLCGE